MTKHDSGRRRGNRDRAHHRDDRVPDWDIGVAFILAMIVAMFVGALLFMK